MARPTTPDLLIDAMPTKELFIDILTRDIELTAAITDLVDNCTDGARRDGAGKDLSGYRAEVYVSADEFSIVDNCGGIPVDVARRYAFKFGRAAGMPSTPGEVGRFGVGMKRALFKIGRHFVVESVTENSRFRVDVDVDQWASSPDWSFAFDGVPVDGRRQSKDDRGTRVVVDRLSKPVSDAFDDEQFVEQLRDHVASRLRDPISRGFRVVVNGLPLEGSPLSMLSDPRLKPAHVVLKPGKAKVRVELFCGLGRAGEPTDARKEAGWYVFCNGRLLLEADKTAVTVWGEEDEESIPAFHNQFNAFRGYAYFAARDAGDLPWNTTKTGIDVDSELYRSVRREMIRLSRPVISFLNRVKEERQARSERGAGAGPLERLVDSASTAPLDRVKTAPLFEPDVKTPKEPVRATLARISYTVPIKRMELAQEALGAQSYREVGERTFDYYFEAECANGSA